MRLQNATVKQQNAFLRSYSDFERDRRSQISYLEFYNIVDANEVFEVVDSPVPADSSQKSYWMRQCKSLSSPIQQQ